MHPHRGFAAPSPSGEGRLPAASQFFQDLFGLARSRERPGIERDRPLAEAVDQALANHLALTLCVFPTDEYKRNLATASGVDATNIYLAGSTDCETYSNGTSTGQGQSSATVNVLWGFLNLVVAYFLICRVGVFDLRAPQDIGALGLGMLLIALFLARRFGKFNGGNAPKDG